MQGHKRLTGFALLALFLNATACAGAQDLSPASALFSPLQFGDTPDQVRAKLSSGEGATCKDEECQAYEIQVGETTLTIVPVFGDDRLSSLVAFAGHWRNAEDSDSLLGSWMALVEKAMEKYGSPTEVRDLPRLGDIASTVVTHRWIEPWGGVELGFRTKAEDQRVLLPVLVASPGIE